MANRRGRIYRRTMKDPVTGGLVERGPYWIQFWFNGKDRRESTHSLNVRVAEKLLTKRLAGKDGGTLDEANLKSNRFEDLEAAITRDYRLNDRASFDRMQDAFLPNRGSTGQLRDNCTASQGAGRRDAWLTI